MVRDDRDAGRRKYGARVYQFDDGVIIVKQTVKRGGSKADRYVIDEDRERHIDPRQNALLARAVQDALAGKLEPPNEGRKPSERSKAIHAAGIDEPPTRPHGLPLSELPALLASLPRLTEDEAADFARDLEAARAELARRPAEDRWTS